MADAETWSASTGPAMAIFAHPDDPEFVAGGTLARWAEAGRRLIYVICTDGSKGTQDAALHGTALITRRQEEQRRAAAHLGCTEVVFLPYEDAMLEATMALRRDLTRLIRRYQPQTVVCFDPTLYYVGDTYLQHPDHRASGEAALAAIFPAARDRLTFPELLTEGHEPHNVEEVFLASPSVPNHWVDISSTIDRKIEAMLCHQSQVSDPERLRLLLRSFAQQAGAPRNLPYAEAFHYVSLDQAARLRSLGRPL